MAGVSNDSAPRDARDKAAPSAFNDGLAYNPMARNGAASLKHRAIAGPHTYDQIPALVERGRLRVENFYGDLEKRLASSPFVAGSQFSVADITAIVTLDFATKALTLPIPAEALATRKWYDSVSVRPSMTA
jgi:glutathione S-transferase